MSLSELLRKGTVRRVGADAHLAAQLISSSERDIKAAGDNLEIGNSGWALAISYNSMLSSGRALMASMGYAPSSDSHHRAVVEFCAAVLPPESGMLVSSFNRFRVRRHDTVYGEAESVGKSEAERSIAAAKEMLLLIRAKIGKAGSQGGGKQ